MDGHRVAQATYRIPLTGRLTVTHPADQDFPGATDSPRAARIPVGFQRTKKGAVIMWPCSGRPSGTKVHGALLQARPA